MRLYFPNKRFSTVPIALFFFRHKNKTKKAPIGRFRLCCTLVIYSWCIDCWLKVQYPWLSIGDKSVETLYLNRVTSENKRIRTPLPYPLHSKLGCLLFSLGMGMGEENEYFLLLKLIKRKKAQFWAKCFNSFCRRLSESKSTRCCLISTGQETVTSWDYYIHQVVFQDIDKIPI